MDGGIFSIPFAIGSSCISLLWFVFCVYAIIQVVQSQASTLWKALLARSPSQTEISSVVMSGMSRNKPSCTVFKSKDKAASAPKATRRTRAAATLATSCGPSLLKRT